MEIIKTRPKLEAIILSSLVVSLICFLAFLIYSKSEDVLEKEIKIGLLSNVSAAATTINGDLHRTFTANTAHTDPAYLSAIEPLERIRQASTNIRYIYTNILKDGRVYFVLNPSPQNDNDGDGQPDQPPALMELYDDAAPELITALKTQTTVVSDPYTDKWGTFISAYAPFHDAEGRFVGVLGMDLQLDDFYQRIYPIRLAFEKTAFIVIFIGLIIGLLTWLSRKYTVWLAASNGALCKELAQHDQRLATTTKGFVSLVEAIAERTKEAETVRWINGWLAYLKVSSQKPTGEDNFNLDTLLERVASAAVLKGGVELSRDATIPQVLSSDQACLEKLIVGLVSRFQTISRTGRITLALHQQAEGVGDILLRLTISAPTLAHPLSEADKTLAPDLTAAANTGVEDLDFFTCIKIIRSMGGKVQWQQTGAATALEVDLTLSKSRETLLDENNLAADLKAGVAAE
ncbi:PDC sensor domain-containing protein [Cohaesibacter haloalkalitolerans]|uniref:PDC sensor domain-containing protein n=1 Tax=Cohaesibacter haloalkalitolerans TaxID=1162980 RepID=UPI000E65E834|nr:PDC sensor domain-containing protein [Cohaesibacter haloalkalitolerans]